MVDNNDAPLPDAWTLENIMQGKAKSHTPITSKHLKRGETQVVSFRVSLEDYAKIQKTVQQRRVPGIETYSDLMTDALFLWLEKFYDENPTVDPGAAQELRMVRLNAERHQRVEFVTLAQKVLTDLIEDRHIKGLDQFHAAMIESKYSYQNQNAPDDFIRDLDRIINQARRLLDESREND